MNSEGARTLAGVEPPHGAIHVWQANLAEWEPQAARLAARLSADERARMARFRDPALAARYGARRGLLRELLGRCLGQDPAALVFSLNEFGKPALNGGPHFNVSHSGQLMLVALSDRQPVGVDLERIGAEPISDQEAERVLSAEEQAAWRNLPGEELAEAFFRVWVRKEAVLKALGVGLNIEPDTFSVGLGRVPEIGRLGGTPVRVLDLEAAGPTLAALATIGPELPETIRRYDLLSALPR